MKSPIELGYVGCEISIEAPHESEEVAQDTSLAGASVDEDGDDILHGKSGRGVESTLNNEASSFMARNFS